MSDHARWRLDDGPPEDRIGEPETPEDSSGLPEPIDYPERVAVADFLAAIASADPEADPLAGVEETGGYPMGCRPEARDA